MLSRPLKVVGTDIDRLAAYDFVLTFHCNQGPISYRFRYKRRFQSIIAYFPHPYVLNAPAEWVPLELVNSGRPQETRMTELPCRERSVTISLAVWIQYTNVTDRRTDIRTLTGQQQRPRLRTASRAKTDTLIIQNDLHGSLSAVTHAPFHASMLRPASQAGPMHDSK